MEKLREKKIIGENFCNKFFIDEIFNKVNQNKFILNQVSS